MGRGRSIKGTLTSAAVKGFQTQLIFNVRVTRCLKSILFYQYDCIYF